jgi:hypothetical protein
MRIWIAPSKSRLREKIHIELEEGEANAVANGVEVKALIDETWIVVSPSRGFLQKIKTKGTSRTSRPTKAVARRSAKGAKK